jgi:hypothetical protein
MEEKKKKKVIQIIVYNLNIPARVCDHVMGQKHEIRHRRTAGGIIMVIGVLMAHFATETHILILTITGDILGYALHGTGLIPFLEGEEKKEQEKEENK